MFKLENIKYKNIIDITNLSIPSGKTTCIVGKSGSGKTTLLRLLNKLISPDSGSIYYQGQALTEINSVFLRRTVVMLPQIPSVFPGTVRDNLEVGLKFSEKPLASEEQLLEALQTVHLRKGLSEPAEKLSGGEKQRLVLGRVILMDPAVFLLDEPSSALDEDTEQLVIEKMATLAKVKNKTLIMITHSKNVAERYSDLMIELKNGRVIKGV